MRECYAIVGNLFLLRNCFFCENNILFLAIYSRSKIENNIYYFWLFIYSRFVNFFCRNNTLLLAIYLLSESLFYFCRSNMLLLNIYSRSKNVIFFCGNNILLFTFYFSSENIITFVEMINNFWPFTLAPNIYIYICIKWTIYYF